MVSTAYMRPQFPRKHGPNAQLGFKLSPTQVESKGLVYAVLIVLDKISKLCNLRLAERNGLGLS